MLVSLDALFPTDHPTVERAGLVLTGWTPGVLHRRLRSATGQWIGVVTILIATTSDGTFKAQDQLVPAEALQPRDHQARPRPPAVMPPGTGVPADQPPRR